MCIRDRVDVAIEIGRVVRDRHPHAVVERVFDPFHEGLWDCLLYTSDAADERSSVDLGGRRIIKKKKQE